MRRAVYVGRDCNTAAAGSAMIYLSRAIMRDPGACKYITLEDKQIGRTYSFLPADLSSADGPEQSADALNCG